MAFELNYKIFPPKKYRQFESFVKNITVHIIITREKDDDRRDTVAMMRFIFVLIL